MKQKRYHIHHSQGNLQLDRFFFFIDANSLDIVETRLYGYCVGHDAIYEQAGFSDQEISHGLSGNGSYVYVEKLANQIRIRQDHFGTYGIYIYQDGPYFALSNSCALLADQVKENHPLTINVPNVHAFLCTDLCSLAYEETMYQEIRLLPRNAEITISIKDKNFHVDFSRCEDNLIEPDSPEGMKILDDWFTYWTGIIRNLLKQEEKIVCDLSGGFDSRLILLLMLGSGIDLNKIRINSKISKEHTFAEDYEIASLFADQYHFQLNTTIEKQKIPYAQDEISIVSDLAKLGCHKQTYFHDAANNKKVFYFTGYGGECIRHYWKRSPYHFIRATAKVAKIESYPSATKKQIVADVKQQLQKSIRKVSERYGIRSKFDSNIVRHLYRETRARYHFGRHMVENYSANTLVMAPLMDTRLHRLKLNSSKYKDENLLMLIIYSRFFPALLDVKFDSKKTVSKHTRKIAQQIQQKYPRDPANEVTEQNRAIRLASEWRPNNPDIQRGNAAMEREKIKLEALNQEILSEKIKRAIGAGVYEVLAHDIQTRNYQPLMGAYTIRAINRVIDDTETF